MPAPPPRPRSSAAWPVSEMKTSSSVGRRSAMSSIPTPAASSRRTASAITPERPRTGTRTTPSSSDGRSAAISASAAIARVGVGAGLERDLESLAADAVLELVRRALGDHVAVVDDHDLVGEAVGLLEVLRGQQHGRALGHARLDRLPHAEPAARVEARRRLVEEDHRRAVDERGGEVEPPPHAAGVGLGGPPAGLGRGRSARAARPRACAPRLRGRW